MIGMVIDGMMMVNTALSQAPAHKVTAWVPSTNAIACCARAAADQTIRHQNGRGISRHQLDLRNRIRGAMRHP
jgi:hypothetical protein